MIWGMIQNTKNNETNNWEDSLENALNNINYIDASHHPMVTAERLEYALKSIAQGKHVRVNVNILKLVADSIFEDHAN